MKRFLVEIPTDYLMGHLRYGHGEIVVEANNEEEAIQKAKDESADIDLLLDDYSVDGYEWDFSSAFAQEV